MAEAVVTDYSKALMGSRCQMHHRFSGVELVHNAFGSHYKIKMMYKVINNKTQTNTM